MVTYNLTTPLRENEGDAEGKKCLPRGVGHKKCAKLCKNTDERLSAKCKQACCVAPPPSPSPSPPPPNPVATCPAGTFNNGEGTPASPVCESCDQLLPPCDSCATLTHTLPNPQTPPISNPSPNPNQMRHVRLSGLHQLEAAARVRRAGGLHGCLPQLILPLPRQSLRLL